MKIKNEKNVMAGKKSAEVRWGPRHSALIELTKLYGKQYQEWFMLCWKTDQLLFLLNAVENLRK